MRLRQTPVAVVMKTDDEQHVGVEGKTSVGRHTVLPLGTKTKVYKNSSNTRIDNTCITS